MYTFTAIRPKPDQWWIVAISWEDRELILSDEDLAAIIGMDIAKMKTEVIKYYGAEIDNGDAIFWNSEYEALKIIQIFFEPRMLAHKLVKN